MNETYIAFVIQGYDDITDEGKLANLCQVTLVDRNNGADETKMIERAKVFISRKYYRCVEVIENFYPNK